MQRQTQAGNILIILINHKVVVHFCVREFSAKKV